MSDNNIDPITVAMLRKTYERKVWFFARFCVTTTLHILFIAYSGVLLFAVSAPYYLWFLWAIYQIVSILHFIMAVADLAAPYEEEYDAQQTAEKRSTT